MKDAPLGSILTWLMVVRTCRKSSTMVRRSAVMAASVSADEEVDAREGEIVVDWFEVELWRRELMVQYFSTR